MKLRSPALVPPRLVRTGGRSKVLAFAFTPDGSSLVVANDDDAVSRHSCADEHGDGAPHAVGRNLCAGVDAVAVDATGTLAVLGGRDKSLVAAPLAGLREPFAPAECLSNVPSQAYGAHWGAVRAVAFDSRGARCASVGDGDAVYVWSVDARAGKALSANRARDRVSFDVGPDTRGRVDDADAGDSDDAGSIPGGIDGDAEPGEGDAFTHKPKLAATPGRERGILKKRPTPAKSALKTDGKYGGGGGGGEDEDARVEEPAVDDDDELEAEDVDADVPVPNEDRPEPPVEPVDAGSRKVTQRSRTGAPPGKKPVAIRPARVIGLSTGAAAAGNESTESAAAVAAATAAAPAIYVPELGSTLFAAGCDVVIERVGGERQQALLRRHPFPITALAHHPETRRIASASASDVGRFDAEGPGECVVCVWDASTGACLRELVHSRAGGCVVSLQFSPEGALLLSAGADPDGALRVWDVATGARVLAAAADAPVAAAGWCTHSPRAEFFTAGADGAWLHSLQDETGTTGSHTVAKIAFDDDDDRASGATRVPKRGFTGASPVCTAACVASDGSLFVGDSRGRVWRSPMRVGLETNGGAVPTLAKCCDALPPGEAVTAVRALPGGRLFVGGARRARVWINALSGVGWEEVGELELDGAVVAANFDAGSSGRGGATGSNPSPNPKPEPWGVVTTSAGSAWLVEIATGTARALVQAHPLDVAHCRVETLGHRTALATTSVDGTARVWDCAAGAKVLEVHADVSARGTRATRAAASPDGTRLCMGCGDGGVAVVVVGAGVGGAAPGVQGPVRHARAHPSGAAVVHASFLRTTTASSFASGPTIVRTGSSAAHRRRGRVDIPHRRRAVRVEPAVPGAEQRGRRERPGCGRRRVGTRRRRRRSPRRPRQGVEFTDGVGRGRDQVRAPVHVQADAPGHVRHRAGDVRVVGDAQRRVLLRVSSHGRAVGPIRRHPRRGHRRRGLRRRGGCRRAVVRRGDGARGDGRVGGRYRARRRVFVGERGRGRLRRSFRKRTERDVRDVERREARGVDGGRGGRVGVQRDVRVPDRRPVRSARK